MIAQNSFIVNTNTELFGLYKAKISFKNEYFGLFQRDILCPGISMLPCGEAPSLTL